MASPFSGTAGRKAANFLAAELGTAGNSARKYLDDAYSTAEGLYGDAQERFSPFAGLGTQAAGIYGDAMGLNGPGGNERAVAAFQTGPGYEFAQDAAAKAGARAASAGGMLNSGNAMIALADRSQGIADQEYDDWLNRMSGLTSMGAQVAGQQAGLDTGLAGLGANIALQKGNQDLQVAQGVGQAGAAGLMAGQQAAANRLNFGMSALTGLGNLAMGMFGGQGGAGMFSPTGAFGGR
ncbi:hypothetical protein GCM10007276_12310 [Agaricicola taiwanensis]|uniref:DNA transfer protein p32 n=1 Tax=Agaricicola taiwanensis TaxID=591372 RepID=A0A8J2YGN2_9RHOB|nr:hypothetical protein [Agaricicola taiwanensis]GGE36370.1 hypothetical protein GCM10007276_12310 [Agaricicola taiwanensis]